LLHPEGIKRFTTVDVYTAAKTILFLAFNVFASTASEPTTKYYSAASASEIPVVNL
jgi:hypothetical protein